MKAPQRPYARVEFAKEGPARFVGHLDLARTFDRMVRRAQLPAAYTEGFNPRAKISFAHPLPVGVESRAELCAIDLEQALPAGEVFHRLQAQCPRGLRVTGVEVAYRGRRSPVAEVAVAEYDAYLASGGPDLAGPVSALLEVSSIEITRRRKSGDALVDLRPGILDLEYTLGPHAVLRMSLRIAGEAVAKPEEIIHALNAGLPPDGQAAVTRLVRTALR